MVADSLPSAANAKSDNECKIFVGGRKSNTSKCVFSMKVERGLCLVLTLTGVGNSGYCAAIVNDRIRKRADIHERGTERCGLPSGHQLFI